MKLLFVGTSRGGGGTESHFVTLSKAMHAAGHEVVAIIHPESAIRKGLEGSGLLLHNGTFRNAFDPRGIRTVWRVCGEFKPDWIIGSFSKEYWPLALIAGLRNVKLALFKHMDFTMRPATHHFMPRLANRFIVISDFMRAQFIARGIDPARIQMLYNPLDTDYFHPDPDLRKTMRTKLGYNEKDVVVGFVGAMHPDKGMLPLAQALNEAMSVMPNIRALWVGEGRAENDLKSLIRNGGFENHHVCQKWSPDVRPYYAAMDILAVPTLVTETFGRVSIEAQACGVPVLCSDLGGLPETMKPGSTGHLLPVGDIRVWRDAILNLAKDDQLHQQLRSKGYDWVSSKFSSNTIAKEFSYLLNDVH